MHSSHSSDISSRALDYIIPATYGAKVWEVCETYMSGMIENTAHTGQILMHNCHEKNERSELQR